MFNTSIGLCIALHYTDPLIQILGCNERQFYSTTSDIYFAQSSDLISGGGILRPFLVVLKHQQMRHFMNVVKNGKYSSDFAQDDN